MAELPPLTILLGPQTRVAFALNAHLRENRAALAEQGIYTVPSRLASPMVRRALDDRSLAERQLELNGTIARGPHILAAINMFGPPQSGLVKGELFPDAEVVLAGLEPVVGQARFVLTIDPLPAFFLASHSDVLEEKVRRTPWELLYELNWYELISELVQVLPAASFLVLTGQGFAKNFEQIHNLLLGQLSERLPHPYMWLRYMMGDTGIAVLDRLLARETPDQETLIDLYHSFAANVPLRDVQDRLGIDKVTRILLEQRFEEDIAQIETLPRVQVL